MLASEIRGVVAVIVVSVVIGVLFVVLTEMGDEPEESAVASAPTSAPTTTEAPTTTVPGADAELARLCLMSENLVEEVAELGEDPPDGPVQQASEDFYDQARDLALEPALIRAEFEAAYEYFREFNDIGSPNDYDIFKIAASGRGERYQVLIDEDVTPLGLPETRAYIGYTCGVALPDDLAIRVELEDQNSRPAR